MVRSSRQPATGRWLSGLADRGELADPRQGNRGELADPRQGNRGDLADPRQGNRGDLAGPRLDIRAKTADPRQGNRGELAGPRPGSTRSRSALPGPARSTSASAPALRI